ncbi:MAG TPA: DUF4280 domain-containing protein [Longimicrobium sp.]|jgi:hypothetical protein|nr:DUF4280 domain-containing protein [Longimicrobium sp.]
MSVQVCMGALLRCSFGAAPGALAVLPLNRVLTGTPAANVMDHLPVVNVPSFGTCSSPANPVVAAATAAALGVLTPMPCVPLTPAPWMPGAATVVLGDAPALDAASKLACAWAGTIEVLQPGQAVEMVP